MYYFRKKFTVKSYLSILTFILLTTGIAAQQKFKMVAIGFYNLENLFDTENDTTINDEDFLPTGKNAWTNEKYAEKQANMAYAISQIAKEHTPAGLSVFGVSEIENKRVLEDLAKQPALASRNYKIIHFDSPDWRGVDVGLMYNPAHFVPIEAKSVPLLVYDNGQREFTRDILFATGLLDGDTFSFLVNHWPSRRGGEEASAYKRNKGAAICRQIVDSLYKVNPNHKVVIMGDLNDDPTSESIKFHLRAKYKQSDVKSGDVFNPMWDYYNRGLGSNAYRDSWSLFDQLIFNSAALDKNHGGYHYQKAFVFNKQFLIQNFGQYKGYPFRTFSGETYQGGYSDHFPVYALLVKESH
ncbi:MAG: endonuclease/exonuclease/phosphatase family protein [Saprospiraceae bacterium]|nr:endonuclease/exonuclease/phosphatase family protein [Saprospiraceae bacterium]